MLGDSRLRRRVCAGSFGGELEGWVWHPSYAQGLCGAAREACPEASGGTRKAWEAPTSTGSTRRRREAQERHPGRRQEAKFDDNYTLVGQGYNLTTDRDASLGSGFRVTNIRTCCTLWNACPGLGIILLGAMQQSPRRMADRYGPACLTARPAKAGKLANSCFGPPAFELGFWI